MHVGSLESRAACVLTISLTPRTLADPQEDARQNYGEDDAQSEPRHRKEQQEAGQVRAQRRGRPVL